MTIKKDLYLDFDSTIVNSEKAICDLYNERYKNQPGFVLADYTKVEDWAFRKQCPLIHVLEKDPVKVVKDMFGEAAFFDKLEFYQDAKAVIGKLAKVYNLVLCSSGHPMNISKKSVWIDQHLDEIKEITFVIDKNGHGYGKKRVAMLEEGAIFIDDHPSNLYSTKASRKILYKYKESNFNQDWTGETVSNWKEIERKLLVQE